MNDDISDEDGTCSPVDLKIGAKQGNAATEPNAVVECVTGSTLGVDVGIDLLAHFSRGRDNKLEVGLCLGDSFS